MPRRSSPAVTTIAIFHFVAGALGMLWTFCRLIDIFAIYMGNMTGTGQPGDPIAATRYLVDNVPGFVAVQVGYTAIGMVFDILLIAAGIGLLMYKRWARYASIGYGISSLLVKLFLLVYTIGFILPASNAYATQEAQKMTDPAQRQGFQTGNTVGNFILAGLYVALMIYPAVVLLVMFLPSVARRFDPANQDNFSDEEDYRDQRPPRDDWRDRDDWRERRDVRDEDHNRFRRDDRDYDR